MQTSKPEVNYEFHDPQIDFTVEWDCLSKVNAIDQNPPECPNCRFVSPISPCVFCGSQCAPGTFTDGVAIYKVKQGEEKRNVKTRVYCIDISGSMQGERINYIKSHLDKELTQFVRSNPEDKVCLITFESDCHIIGDGTKDEVLVGCESSFEKIIDIAEKHKELKNVRESVKFLREKISKIECAGRTASVSALALATAFASFTGGEVFFYTDGMRNKGLPRDKNVEKIIKRAHAQGEVFIHICFFSNCQAFITEYSDCADQTKGKIEPIHLGKEKRGENVAVKREYIAYDLKITTRMGEGIIDSQGSKEITIEKVANNENFPINFTVPKDSSARTKIGQDIYSQCKVEFKDQYGSLMKAYILGNVKVVSTIPQEDLAQFVSSSLNRISNLIEAEKYREAREELGKLLNIDFRISTDSNNFFKNAFSELLSYLDHIETKQVKKDDVVALLSYMKTARKDGIKV